MSQARSKFRRVSPAAEIEGRAEVGCSPSDDPLAAQFSFEPMVVRPFAEKDRPVLESIYRESRAEAAWLPAALRGHSHFSQATEGEVILVAAGDNDDPVGFVSVWEPDRFVHHLYVRRGDRRKGIGTALLDALALTKPWRLKCLRANSEAAAFYRIHGWIEISSGISDEGPFALWENA